MVLAQVDGRMRRRKLRLQNLDVVPSLAMDVLGAWERRRREVEGEVSVEITNSSPVKHKKSV